MLLIISIIGLDCFAENVELPYEYNKHTGYFRDMAISEDGTLVAVGSNGRVFLIENGEWREIAQPIFDDFTGIEYGNECFYAISEHSVYSSHNGKDWYCVNLELDIGEAGAFYYNGENFVFEKENKSITDTGMMQTKANDICLTKDFLSIEKIGEVSLENKLSEKVSNDFFNEIFGSKSDDKFATFSFNEAYEIMFGAGTTDTRDVSRKIKLFNDLTNVNYPVSAEEIKYIGRNNGVYEIFYISDYNLIRATTVDFETWETSTVALPNKEKYSSNISIVYADGYYIKYPTNETYNGYYVYNIVQSVDLNDFAVLTSIKEQNVNMHLFEDLYILKNESAYKVNGNNLIKCFEIPNEEKVTVKYSNGKYIKWAYEDDVCVYLSDNGETWNKVENPDLSLQHVSNADVNAYYDVLWDGERYIIRYTGSDNGYNPSGAKGYLYMFDTSLNLIKKVQFDTPVLDMSYENGNYHAITNIDGLLYSSTDFENWQSQDTDMNIPIANNKTSIIKQLIKAEKGFNIADFQTKVKIKDNFSDISFEKYTEGDITVSGDYYIKINGTAISLSNDGVYWKTIDLPSGIKKPKSVYVADNVLCVKTDDTDLRYDISKLYVDNHIYVGVGEKLLGFDTEPVIESERILVPLRFVFESMGADVEWENSSRRAVINDGETTINFSIDNTIASINGTNKVMDVPARLVNSRTMVPLRFLSEELGFNVLWDQESRTATISR